MFVDFMIVQTRNVFPCVFLGGICMFLSRRLSLGRHTVDFVFLDYSHVSGHLELGTIKFLTVVG